MTALDPGDFAYDDEQRHADTTGPEPPDPEDRADRSGRCPDGGYCHGSTIAAGSPPCPEGTCYRVRFAGPLSGVFPGNRWPEHVLRANGVLAPARHLVEVEVENEDDEETPYVVRFVCEAPADALCRSWCVEGCEEECRARDVYVSAEPLDPIAQAPVDAHRFVPMDPPSCRVADYLNAGDRYDRAELHAEDEPLRPGSHPIVEEWDGDGYLWTYAEPEPEPAYPGHP